MQNVSFFAFYFTAKKHVGYLFNLSLQSVTIRKRGSSRSKGLQRWLQINIDDDLIRSPI